MVREKALVSAVSGSHPSGLTLYLHRKQIARRRSYDLSNHQTLTIRVKTVKVTFSIVATTHNGLARLERAIESALAQTIPCEVILVDDGSNDGTQAYGRSLGTSITYYRNRVRLGYGASLNIGVDLAQGNWIKFLNDAERLEPSCLERIKHAIERFPKAALVSCQAIEMSPDAHMHRTPSFGNKEVECVSQKDIHYQMLVNRLSFGCPAQVAVRRDAFFRAGGWSSLNILNYEAMDSWTRMSQYGDAIFINQPLSYYQAGATPSQDWHFNREQLEAKLALDRNIYERIPQNYRSKLAESPELQQFLKLHWSLVGLQHDIELHSNPSSDRSSRSIMRTWSRLARWIANTFKGNGDRESSRKVSNTLGTERSIEMGEG